MFEGPGRACRGLGDGRVSLRRGYPGVKSLASVYRLGNFFFVDERTLGDFFLLEGVNSGEPNRSSSTIPRAELVRGRVGVDGGSRKGEDGEGDEGRSDEGSNIVSEVCGRIGSETLLLLGALKNAEGRGALLNGGALGGGICLDAPFSFGSGEFSSGVARALPLCRRAFTGLDLPSFLRDTLPPSLNSSFGSRPSAKRGLVAVSVRAHAGTTYGFRGATAAVVGRAGEEAATGRVATRLLEGPGSTPESDIGPGCGGFTALRLFEDGALRCLLDWLIVRLRVLSRSRSRSSIKSLSVRLRLVLRPLADFEGVLVFVVRTLAVVDAAGGSRSRDDVGGMSFSLPRRRKAEGLTFSLSSSTISSSDGFFSGLGGGRGA